jgi:hypothetical protein
VAGATPFPKMGWPDHPISLAHPQRSVWGGRSHPQALGGGPATPKGPKKKKKNNERMGFGLWGWPDHPLGPGGGFGHPLPAVGGGRSHPQALMGVVRPPPTAQTHFFVFFFFLGGLSGWPDGHGPTPIGRYEVASATPIHFPFLFFFFFFFNFLLFLKKKKKN